jgi:drug/metabolite transporter (DMT)-like permease
MTTIVTVRFVGVVVVLVGALCRVTPVARLPRDRWRQMLALTLIDTSAFVAFTTGIRIGSVAIVATLTGLYAAVTVDRGVLLGERLRPVLREHRRDDGRCDVDSAWMRITIGACAQ